MSDFMKQMQMVLYHSDDGDVTVNVYIKDEDLWITQKAMAELFGIDKSGISRHLKNIFATGELDETVVVAIFATTISSSNSLSAKIFFKCLLIEDLSTANNSAIAFCVSQMVSSLITALTETSSSAARYIKNSNSWFMCPPRFRY